MSTMLASPRLAVIDFYKVLELNNEAELGTPEMELFSASHAEPANPRSEWGSRRSMRLTNEFSKILETHRQILAIQMMN